MIRIILWCRVPTVVASIIRGQHWEVIRLAKSNTLTVSLHDDTYDKVIEMFEECKKAYRKTHRDKDRYTWELFFRREVLKIDLEPY